MSDLPDVSCAAPVGERQPWSDDAPPAGRVVLVTDNPVAQAIGTIATIAGREAVVLRDDVEGQTPLQWLTDHPLGDADAFVLCDHDTPDAGALLTAALGSASPYVAMMGSRRRAEAVFAHLRESTDEATLAKLRVPAGLNIGGKAPGEIALSVVAEIVATSYGRPGGPMRAG